MDTHSAIMPSLSEQTLEDIEGLDPAQFGFDREECCGPSSLNMPSNMVLAERLFLASEVPAAHWGPKLENVPEYNVLSERLKTAGKIPLAVFHCPVADACILRFLYEAPLKSVAITQYSCFESGELPWECSGVLSCDKSNEAFIFVCAHRLRDSRCGYCGAVLVDLFRQSIRTKKGDGAPIHVYPCSHVGGHAHAGNVLVYTKKGGVCFGCFRPADVDTLVDSLLKGNGEIPQTLRMRVRGMVGFEEGLSGCSMM
ncbi:hypothetical protein TRVL_06337 [Trypanosoma vivax]|nr:hypothetical protein TRVL_06337 [Trypanosoma vivax]